LRARRLGDNRRRRLAIDSGWNRFATMIATILDETARG
jgi:hypothetical protein